MKLEDVVPVSIVTSGPCKGCNLGFEREEYEGKWWQEWEGRAYPCCTAVQAPLAATS